MSFNVQYEIAWSLLFSFKRHYCAQCGSTLVRKKLTRMIDRESEEAYRYNVFDSISGGDIKLITYCFECLQCKSTYTAKEQKQLESVHTN